MNRNNEFTKLQQELEDTPLKLDFTLERARAKRDAKRKKVKRRAIFAPFGSVAAVFAAFVLMVNLSPSFAYAAGRIPLIKELAQAVAASPSLSAAVENEYVQPIELEQTENGITARIEYAIVDQKQLNLFFTLHSEEYSDLESVANLERANGAFLSGGVSYSNIHSQDGDIRKITADFIDADVPDKLNVTLKVYQRASEEEKYAGPNEDSDRLEKAEYKEPDFIAELSFTVSLDPCYTGQGETIELGSPVELNGQKLVLEKAEVYPTHMRFTFDDDPENTAWLVALDFYVENEKGERFGGISNGISASGDTDSPMMKTYMLESAFFAESKELTMYITDTTWLDKSLERVLVDLENKTAEKLPEGVRFERAEKKENGWRLGFSAPQTKDFSYSVFGWKYYGLDGKEYELDGKSSTTGGHVDEDSGKYVEQPERFVEEFELYEYTDSQVYLCPMFSQRIELTEPVEIKIK